MMTGNIGEWSEVYALLKLVSDQTLVPGDENLQRLENLVLPIIRILREESDGTYEYQLHQQIIIISGAGHTFSIPINEFQQKAASLLNAIQNANTGVFSVTEIEEFISTFNCSSLKANSRIKSDIRIVIHDAVTGNSPILGFSIKSQLGGASTLLNAGVTTNFIFRLVGNPLTLDQINEVNLISTSCKIRDRLARIYSLGNTLEFERTVNPTFSNNLTLIDSALPKILSHLVFAYFSSNLSLLKDLIQEVSHQNPLGFDLSTGHPFYIYKIKRLLTDIALGMMPSRVWTGELEATGGYLVVKNNGEIVSYHIYNRNDFENYLFNNTKLESASSTRHQYGAIYQANGCQYFNLNLQIRFIN